MADVFPESRVGWRFRNPVYPGETIVIAVKQTDALAGFTMLSGAVKKTDGTRVLTIDFSVAWKAPVTAPAP